MNDLKSFSIPYKGLKIGNHSFEWKIKNKFFESFENADIKQSTLNVKMEMDRQERMFVLQFNIEGNITTACDRCLGDLIIPVSLNEGYIIKLGNERLEESENMSMIPETDDTLEVADLIYDFIVLSLPIKKVHDEEDCDSDTLDILDDLNSQQRTDPRWDALKNINFEND